MAQMAHLVYMRFERDPDPGETPSLDSRPQVLDNKDRLTKSAPFTKCFGTLVRGVLEDFEKHGLAFLHAHDRQAYSE